MPRYKLKGDCYGPTVRGKEGDVVELSEVDAAPLGSLLAPYVEPKPKKKAAKRAKKK